MNAHTLALPLPKHRTVVVALTATVKNIYHPLSAILQPPASADPAPFIARLREMQFEADLFYCDSLATMRSALEFCSPFGEGVLVADEAGLQAELFDLAAPHRSLLNHVWAHVSIKNSELKIKNAGGDIGVLYFAKALQSGRPAHFRLPLPLGGEGRGAGDVFDQLRRDRLKLRLGPEAASYAVTEDTAELWSAATEECLRGGRRGANHWNLSLTKSGAFKCGLSKFDTYSTRRVPGEVSRLFALNGKELKAIVVNRPLRQLLASLLSRSALPSDGNGERAGVRCARGWRIHPAVAVGYQSVLRNAIATRQGLRAGIPHTDLPAGLRAELRPYQKEGFDFLAHLSRLGRGGLLADDMGLGKTLQTLTWLLWLKQQTRMADGGWKMAKASTAADPSAILHAPASLSLVVCPASVTHNWRREAEQFTPDLKVLVLESGPGRAAQLAALANPNGSNVTLVITNYALLRRDLAALAKLHFHAVVLDEAQFIKNPGAQISRLVKQLNATHRLALTGTPLENRLLDLWSIMDFAAPGYLGTQQQFRATYEVASPATRKALARQLRPVLLRRLKADVAKDLPARVELRRDCSLGRAQKLFYSSELARSRTEVFQAVAANGLQKSKLHVFAALTRLRQICCHPGLVGDAAPSGKTEAFFELLTERRAAGKKVLVFSQFTRMLDRLQSECQARGIPTFLLTGETRDRQAVVDAFNAAGKEDGRSKMEAGKSHPPHSILHPPSPILVPVEPSSPPVFLLSLRAAGTGLNLTSASEVILYDPWWNPAVEAQAIDRAHRIGQSHCVTATRLIMRDTIEERIWTIQQAKQRTIGAVLGEGATSRFDFTRSLTKTDLEYLFGGEITETSNLQPPTSNAAMIPSLPPLRVAESAEQWGEGRGEVANEHPTTNIEQPTSNSEMIPRHASNRRTNRNTRAHSHSLSALASEANGERVGVRCAPPSTLNPQSSTAPTPLWRQRLRAKVPAWRANYGLAN